MSTLAPRHTFIAITSLALAACGPSNNADAGRDGGVATISFAAGTPLVGSAGSGALAAADLNGDGHLDLVTSNMSDGVVAFLGRGNGTFMDPITSDPGLDFVRPVLGDVNGDRHIDVVGVRRMNARFAVLLGDGTGAFGAAMDTGGDGWSATLADVNADNHLDVILPISGPNGTVNVYLGNGDGTFGGAQTAMASGDPEYAAVGDLDNDGHADIAVTDWLGTSVNLLPGHNDGTFGAAMPFQAANATRSILVADLDGDMRADLLTSSADANLAVFLNSASGLRPAAGYPAGGSIAVGDVNGDGRLDVATQATNTMNARIFITAADGTLTTGTSVMLGVEWASVENVGRLVLADFNGDGLADLAGVGGAGVFLALNTSH